MFSTTRFLSQSARKLQSGFSQLTGLAKPHGASRPSVPSRPAAPEGLGARQARQEAAMAPRNPSRPEAARHSPAPGNHSAPTARPAPGRPAVQTFTGWQGPVMAQHIPHAPSRPIASSSSTGRAAAPEPVGLQQVHAMAQPAAHAVHRTGRYAPAASAEAPRSAQASTSAAPAPRRAASLPTPSVASQRTHAQQIAEATAHLTAQLTATSRMHRRLIDVRDDAQTDEDYDKADSAIRALRQQREPLILMNNLLSGADRNGSGQMRKLQDFAPVPIPIDPGALRHPGHLRTHADALQRNAAALRSAHAQFGPVRELAGRAEMLRAALAQHDLPPAARQELQAVLRGFDRYAELDAMVRSSDRAIRRMGGAGLLDGTPTTAAGRREAEAAARQAHQAALDNGY